MPLKVTLIIILYLVVASVYNMLGVYVLSLDARKSANRLFFAANMALCFWALCFGIRNFNITKELSGLVTLVSVFGWGTIFSFIYHFIKTLRHGDKKYTIWFYVLVYGSALVNIILFLVVPLLTGEKSNIVYTSWGWTALASARFREEYYNFYYAVLSIATFKNLYYWYQETKDEALRFRIKLLSISLIAVAVFVIPTEIVINRVLQQKIIQLMAVWMIIPTLTMFYMIHRYRFLFPSIKISHDQMLDEKLRRKLFRFITHVYLFTSCVVFIMHYANGGSGYGYALYCLLIYLLGIGHFLVNKFANKVKTQYWYLTLTASVVIVISTVIVLESGFFIFWTMYFFYIMLTALLDKPIYLYFLSVVMIFAELVQWIVPSPADSILDWKDHFLRIVIIIITSIVVQLIRQLSFKKYYEILDQITAQKTLTSFSKDFISITSANSAEKFQRLLMLCNQKFGHDRTYISQLSDDSRFVLAYYDEREKINRPLPGNDNILLCDLINVPLIKDKLLANEAVIIKDLNDYRKNNLAVEKAVANRDVINISAFPIVIDCGVIGALVFERDDYIVQDVFYNYKRVFATLVSDAFKKMFYEEQLFKNTHFDEVTNLYSRRHFTETISELFRKSTSSDQHAILFIDIDNFKSINDTFGHSIGDEVLRSVAKILMQNKRFNDIVSRFGGDEFLIACPSIRDKYEVIAYVKKMLTLFETPINISHYEFRLGISIGIALYPIDGSDSETLFKNADLAMYESKKLGKHRFFFCNEIAKERATENAIYINKLHEAFEKNQFKLVFQPQMDIRSGKIVGAEALLRWYSPEFGLVAPNKFISLLEQTGLINEVGAWIIEQVAEQQMRLAKMGLPKLRFAINISVVQLQNDLVLKTLKSIIDDYNIDPSYIELEITESVAISEMAHIVGVLMQIKSMRYQIAIDDFGLEFSSLNRLQAMPLDRLKIDKSFIDGVGVDEKRERIVKVIINLAKSLDLSSIAEGVEKADQQRFLVENGCDEIQGYYYAKPMSIDALETFVRKNS